MPRIKKPSEYAPSTLKIRFYTLKKAGKPITDEFNDALARAFTENYDPINRKFFRKSAHEQPTLKPIKQYNITNKDSIKSVQIKHNKNYETVLINGKKFITNVKNVKLKTFMDNMVLAIRYTDNKNIQQWGLFNSDIQPILNNHESRWYIEKVNCVNDVLYLNTDSHAQIALSKKSILRKVIKPGFFNINNGR